MGIAAIEEKLKIRHCHTLIPANQSITAPIKPSTPAVPKSGCRNTNATGAKINIKANKIKLIP